jgi:hypothetical protein
MTATVAAAAGPFAVTSPNTATTWSLNDWNSVTWDVANTNSDPVNCTQVNILLSSDGGNTFRTVLTSTTVNDGEEEVWVGKYDTTTARVKVECVGNIFFDISNADFTIMPSDFDVDSYVFLPLIMKSAGPPGPDLPDLVVTELLASSTDITVVIKNQGSASTADDEDFWVDVYIDPRQPPSLNKIWQAIAEQGLAWWVTDPIAPGGELTLTIGGKYYWPEESKFSGMAPGTPVWAQVDAVNYETSYGAVLEKNEGNNVYGPVSAVASPGGVVAPPLIEDVEPVPSDERLPGRH